MLKYLLAAVSMLFLVAAGPVPQPENARMPAEIRFASSVGEVTFLHTTHVKDRSIPCVECHHQINAKKLDTPHPEYLKSSAVKCNVCHDESGKIKRLYSCSACHHTAPTNIADETLSTKVVVHKQCWKCHQTSTGKDAAASCQLCHSGKKTM